MEKLNGKKKLRVSVFISGRGTNLKSLINFSNRKSCPIKIVLVITNNKNAKGIYFAKKNKIKLSLINYKNKTKAEKKILFDLKKYNVDLICLAGFMRILSKKIVNFYKGKILNIHPSLLPKYKGLNTHYKVIKNREKFSGATVHIVNEKLDAGKIIIQEKVRILKSDIVKTLEKKVLKIEHKIYPKAIIKLITNY